MRAYSGGVLLTNKTGSSSVSIDLISGQVKIDLTTVTNGQIVVRGNGKVIDATTGEWLSSGTYGSLQIVNETTYGTHVQDIHRAHFNKRVWDRDGNSIVIYDTDGVTPLYIFEATDAGNVTTIDPV